VTFATVPAVVTFGTWVLALPGAVSLKHKRSVLRSIKDRLAKKNVSVVESGLQDSRSQAQLSVVFLAAGAAQADSILASVDRTIAEARGAPAAPCSAERL